MKNLITKIPSAAKAVVAFLGLFIPWASTALPDGRVTSAEWWQLAIVLSAPVLVWATPNKSTPAPATPAAPEAPATLPSA